jgi:hypothetical protein
MIDANKLSELRAQGITVIFDPSPEPDHSKPLDQGRRIVSTGPVLINGQWHVTSSYETMTAEEREANRLQATVFARSQRDKYLRKSDIYVLPDRWTSYTADTQAMWTNIRQGLRDLTNQPNFPYDIVWPQLPEVLFNE